MTLSVGQNRLNLFRRDLKLLCDFDGADAIIKVIDNSVDRHSCTAQHGGAALHSRLNLDQRAFRPVNCFHGHYTHLQMNMISSFHIKATAPLLARHPRERGLLIKPCGGRRHTFQRIGTGMIRR